MDKIALVTGANRGIGFAIAQGLLRKDVTVVATSRNLANKEEMIEKLSPLGRIYYSQLDVTNLETINQTVAFVQNTFNRLDILINNAGINYDDHQNVSNASMAEVRNTLETNFIGPWQVIQQFLPLLKNSSEANIVNVSSGAGSWKDQDGTTPAYSISKLALNGMTRAFANTLISQQINVNAVCPGWVRSDMGGSNATRSLAEGADGIIWAGLLQERNVTGKFFRDGAEVDW